VAKAGDGAPRSERRQLSDVINIRVSFEEKRAFGRAARKCGAPSLSAFAMDQMRKACGGPTRAQKVLAGSLGQIAGRLQELAGQAQSSHGPDLAQMVRDVANVLNVLQQEVMSDDRESHT